MITINRRHYGTEHNHPSSQINAAPQTTTLVFQSTRYYDPTVVSNIYPENAKVNGHLVYGRFETKDVHAPDSSLAHVHSALNPVSFPLNWEETQSAELDYVINCSSRTYAYSVSSMIDIEGNGIAGGMSAKIRAKKTGTVRTVTVNDNTDKVICACCSGASK